MRAAARMALAASMVAGAAFSAALAGPAVGPVTPLREIEPDGQPMRPKRNRRLRRHGRKLRPNRLHISRRVKRRHRKAKRNGR